MTVGIEEYQAGTEIQAIEGHGASFWTRTARVGTKLKTGSLQSYFLKVSWRQHFQDTIPATDASHRCQIAMVPNR